MGIIFPQALSAISIFSRKFAKIFATHGAPPVLMTPAANLPLCQQHRRSHLLEIYTDQGDTDGIFSASVMTSVVDN